MRCCGNCEWSISLICEEGIMSEGNYEEGEDTRPKVGDCVLSIDHNGEYVCKEHDYIENGISNYFLYDDTYLGPGYFIITEYYDEIIKFIKLYKTGNGFPGFAIRGYELPFKDRKSIQVNLTSNNTIDIDLLEVMHSFIQRLNNNVLIRNKLKIYEDENGISIILWKFNTQKEYVDINLGDYNTCLYYKEVSLLFRDLAWASNNRTDKNIMKKILKMNK